METTKFCSLVLDVEIVYGGGCTMNKQWVLSQNTYLLFHSFGFIYQFGSFSISSFFVLVIIVDDNASIKGESNCTIQCLGKKFICCDCFSFNIHR